MVSCQQNISCKFAASLWQKVVMFTERLQLAANTYEHELFFSCKQICLQEAYCNQNSYVIVPREHRGQLMYCKWIKRLVYQCRVEDHD